MALKTARRKWLSALPVLGRVNRRTKSLKELGCTRPTAHPQLGFVSVRTTCTSSAKAGAEGMETAHCPLLTLQRLESVEGTI